MGGIVLKKLWIGLGIVLVIITIGILSFCSIKLTRDDILTLDVTQSDNWFSGEISEDEIADLIDDLEPLTFWFSRIVRELPEQTEYEYSILIRDKSGKSAGLVRVYDESTITYTTTLLGYFHFEYVAKGGTLDLEKLKHLAD